MNDSKSELILKYNVPTPRYTSYPTVPYWDNKITTESWGEAYHKSFEAFNHSTGISVYIHLPYCESLCTFCGCNKRITKQHAVELPYIDALLKEWAIYRETFNEKPILAQIHLGGGTPTFFSPENLKTLITQIKSDCTIPDNIEFSFEGHPSNTTFEHLSTLNTLGFDRVSYGIQDFDDKVQKVINRYQTVEEVEKTVADAISTGYKSINFDLVYGLPFQNKECLNRTITEIIQLKPDRIAFYSYAHVPWAAKSQRLYTEDDLPTPDEKLELYHIGKKMFVDAGYVDIGMDHFALESDELYVALQEGRLHRNFMGYTTNNTKLMIGLGVSSISDAYFGYAQNHKTIEEYKRAVNDGKLPIIKGHILTDDEIASRTKINELMCNYQTSWSKELSEKLSKEAYKKLLSAQEDGLVSINEDALVVTKKGKNFVRNIATVLDEKLWGGEQQKQLFSKAV